MIPTIAENGTSFKGAAAYYLHDKDADTRERVEWTHTENLPGDNPETAWKVMTFTANDAERLKHKAGIKAGGRKLEKPVFSFSLAWHPEQKPPKAHMLETALDAVKYLGLADYQALYVCHNDEPHRHVHVIVNRVHPETGLAWDDGRSQPRIQKWAAAYEKKHGKIYCPRREKNARSREKKEPTRAGDTVIVAAWEQSDNGKSFQAALQEHGYRLARGRDRIVVVDRWGKATNPARHLNIRVAAFRARIADIDEDRLPTATALQQQAKKQDRQEYHASRKFDFWTMKVKNEMQDRQIAARAKLSDKYHRRIFERRDELQKFYKFEERRAEIARLKTALKNPSLMRKFTGKEKADRDELHRQEALFEDGTQKMADEIQSIENERARAFAEQEQRHADEQARALQMIEQKKPEFYRDEIVKAHAEERERREPRTGGRDRGRTMEHE